MDRCKYMGGAGTIIGVLANVARELSSTDEWESRASSSLRMLHEWLPQSLVAAGLQAGGRWVVLSPHASEITTDFSDHLRRNFLALTGRTEAQALSECELDDNPDLTLHDLDSCLDSILTLPIATDGRVLGVLHVHLQETTAPCSDENLELLAVVASQLGLYVRNVEARLGQARSHKVLDDFSCDADQCIKEFDTFVDVMTDAVAIFDAASTTVRANATVINKLGFDPRDAGLKNTLKQAYIRHPDGTPVAFPDMTTSRALRGELVKAEPMIIRGADGRDRYIIGSASPIKSNGRIVGAMATWHDITEQKHAQLRRETHLAHLKMLLQASTAILAADSMQELLQCVAATARQLTGAPTGACAYGCSGDGFRASAFSGGAPIGASYLLDPNYTHVHQEIMRSERPVRHSTNAAQMPDPHIKVVLGVPLRVQGEQADGLIIVADPQICALREESEALMEQLAVIASLRIRNMEANADSERRAAEAEESKRILEALLEHAPDGIIVADAPDASVRAISRRGLEMVGAAGATAEETARSGLVWQNELTSSVCAEDMPTYRAVVHGSNIANEEWVIRRPDGTEIPVLCNAGPIRDSDGEIIGAIVTYRDVTAIKAAQSAMQAAYDRDHHISEVLQQALLPAVSLDTSHYQITAEYHAALVEAEVGGDFYDVFEIGDGWLALVMGDVSGKGLSAAVYTSMAKYMIRAYAHEDAEPKSVLRRLNEALAEFMSDESFITVFYALYDTRRRILAYANAGHEPPIMYGSELGVTTELDVTGPAVGMIPKVDYGQRVMPMLPESVLVIYTDGITDSRIGTDFFGTNGLAAVVTQHSHSAAQTIAAKIYQAALKHSQGCLSDDAALLVLKPK